MQRALWRRMRPDQARVLLPATHDPLFPHREFPPYVALEAVNRQIDDLVHRARDSPLDLDRVQALLIDVAERLVEAAQGSLSLPRWYRRLAVSMRLCHEAKQALLGYARRGSLTVLEAQSLSDGIGGIVDRLNEAIARADLPDEVREAMPLLAPPDELR
jgi:hypothetical protein